MREQSRYFIRAVVAVCALGVLTAAPRADEGNVVNSATRSLPFVHLYTDAKGNTHFRDEQLTFKATMSGGTEQALASYELPHAQGATLLSLKRGATEDWHRAPRRMYLIPVQGTSEVTVGDGEVRRFGPGTILLMDDTTGKGHITKVVGDTDHVALTIPVPN